MTDLVEEIMINVVEHAQAVLANCRDCSCGECTEIRTQLILDLIAAIEWHCAVR
jgi:hypothetical protein